MSDSTDNDKSVLIMTAPSRGLFIHIIEAMPHQVPHMGPILVERCPVVCDGVPALGQNWVLVTCWLGNPQNKSDVDPSLY